MERNETGVNIENDVNFFIFIFTKYEGYCYWLTNSMADFITIQYIRHRN